MICNGNVISVVNTLINKEFVGALGKQKKLKFFSCSFTAEALNSLEGLDIKRCMFIGPSFNIEMEKLHHLEHFHWYQKRVDEVANLISLGKIKGKFGLVNSKISKEIVEKLKEFRGSELQFTECTLDENVFDLLVAMNTTMEFVDMKFSEKEHERLKSCKNIRLY